jgi:hypothetical protein
VVVFDIYQQGQIGQAQNAAQSAAGRADRALDQVTQLERRVDRLTLACQALYELLCESGACAESRLVDKMQEIDLRDGRADGKISRTPVTCPRCSRLSNSKRLVCVYCGSPLGNPNLFDAT